MEELKQEESAGRQEVHELTTAEQKLMEAQVVEALRMCYDPEIPVNIYELGLVYDIKVAADGGVLVVMTLTTPHCPVAQTLPKDVERRIKIIPGVTAAFVTVVWDPPWNPSMMSEAARLELGF